MEVTITDLSPCKKQLRIEIDAETVNAKFDAVAKDFRRHAHLPGFRPGKAPLANVMRSYGDKIGEEAKRTLMSDSYARSEEHTSELQSRRNLVCRLLLEKKKTVNDARNSSTC